MSYQFISYSSVDGRDFALRLADALEAGPPSFPVWLDQRKLRPGDDWDEQIAEAIRKCECLLFVMTPDSVASNSVAKQEWTRALKYKKPVIPLLLDPRAEMPFRLEPRQYIDFSGDFDPALARLREHLGWLKSKEGVLHGLKEHLDDARRDLSREQDPHQQSRIREEIARLEKQIAEKQNILADPEAASKRVDESITRRIAQERRPEQPAVSPNRSRVINQPPTVSPLYFQNRFIETEQIISFLENDAQRLMTIIGRGGIGKTAMVCRLLKALENNVLPEGRPFPVNGIVYLSASGLRSLTFSNLFLDLCRLLPEQVSERLNRLHTGPDISARLKMQNLLAEFPSGRVVVLLDNFEDALDRHTFQITEPELNEALRALLELPQHSVKLILTTRYAIKGLALIQAGRQVHLNLEQGLERPYAEKLLRAMDEDGTAGLREAPDELLAEARRRTSGSPRALELLYAILKVDRNESLTAILENTRQGLPEELVQAWASEAIDRLDRGDTQMMQALAIYGRPVSAAAVDFLLKPYVAGVDSEPALKRLVNMHLVRRLEDRYILHPVDQQYALSKIEQGRAADRGGDEYTQFALLHRGAEFFRQTRLPPESWQEIDDLTPQLAEFDLRLAAREYDAAAEVLFRNGVHNLFDWSHYRQAVERLEQLQDKLSSPQLRLENAVLLGRAFQSLGSYPQAQAAFEQALAVAREIGRRDEEGRILGSLGLVYKLMGDTRTGIDLLEQALGIAHEIDDRPAIGYQLGSLGLAYADQGDPRRAIDYLQQALGIARETDNLSIEGRHLASLAEAWIDAERFPEAIRAAQESARIAAGQGRPVIASLSYGYLALAQLYSGDLDAGYRAIEEACRHEEPQNFFDVLALKGVIALRQSDRPAAESAFKAAVSQTEEVLKYNPKDHRAHSAKGLSLCGLVLCGHPANLAPAVSAYRAARTINDDPGIVQRALRLLDALAYAHPQGVSLLAPARQAASDY